MFKFNREGERESKKPTMEIQGTDGSKTLLKPNSSTLFGRGNGFHTKDLSVSRRQISFDFNPSPNTQTAPRVSFEVLGKNPVWVLEKHQEDAKIKAFKRFQRGELGIDDLFCVSPKPSVWFSLKKVEKDVEESDSKCEVIGEKNNAEISESLEFDTEFKGSEDFGLDFVDVSNIDPVKEFGFLVIGHEFDQYPEIKKWDWFLDDPRGDSDDDEVSKKKRMMGGGRKRKKTSRDDDDDDADEEWTADSEGEELTTNARKVPRPTYRTRSKDHGVHKKGGTNKKPSSKISRKEDEEESEDEEDETLGGFVVDDDDDIAEEDQEDEIDEDEEKEFIEDEDEDELED